ncbi:MAG: hypothetical protein ACR2N7_12765 [Acidimicrobiia bacterium]
MDGLSGRVIAAWAVGLVGLGVGVVVMWAGSSGHLSGEAGYGALVVGGSGFVLAVPSLFYAASETYNTWQRRRW